VNLQNLDDSQNPSFSDGSAQFGNRTLIYRSTGAIELGNRLPIYNREPILKMVSVACICTLRVARQMN